MARLTHPHMGGGSTLCDKRTHGPPIRNLYGPPQAVTVVGDRWARADLMPTYMIQEPIYDTNPNPNVSPTPNQAATGGRWAC
jgi:hypothetical protein